MYKKILLTLKKIRKSQNKSGADLANYLGVSYQTIANWESGRRKMGLEMAVKYLEFLNLTWTDVAPSFDEILEDEKFKKIINLADEPIKSKDEMSFEDAWKEVYGV